MSDFFGFVFFEVALFNKYTFEFWGDVFGLFSGFVENAFEFACKVVFFFSFFKEFRHFSFLFLVPFGDKIVINFVRTYSAFVT